MAPAALFNPPAADLPGKPSVRPWNPPPVTQEKENFAELSSIDLSLLDSEDPAVVEALVQKVKSAIRDDGFLFLENYGISLEQVSTSERHPGTDELMSNHLHSLFVKISSTVSLPWRSTCMRTSAKKTRANSYSTPRQAGGRATSTHMASR